MPIDRFDPESEPISGGERILGYNWAEAETPPHAARLRVLEARLGELDLRPDRGQVDRLIAAFESEIAELPAADPWRRRALAALGRAWRVRGRLLGREWEIRRGLELIVDAGADVSPHHPDAAALASEAALARAALTRPGSPEDPSRPGAPGPGRPGR